MARALLIVPPLIKYTAGPLLGPSLLKSAAVARGHACQVLDLNAHWLSRERTGESSRTDLIRGPFVGDHDKPRTSQGESFLSLIEQRFLRQHILPGLDIQDNDEASLKRIRLAFLDHTDIRRAALYMHSSNFGSWAKDQLAGITTSPGVVGLSLLHAGQVIPAVAITWLVREMWPSAVVAWGGPHLSGLGLEALQQDLPERLSYTADIFVLGHAEETFVQLLDEAKEHTGSILIGQRSKRAVSPLFDSLNLYDTPVTLPAQSSIGCAYGKCKFCTYPVVEPRPAWLPLETSIEGVVDQAMKLPVASITVKDSLATPLRLQQLASCINGRVKWAACTKLSTKFDVPFLEQLRNGGLTTLEVGLESLLPETQRRVSKVQPIELYQNFVQNLSRVPEMSLVVNYITGFPWEEAATAQEKLQEAGHIAKSHLHSRVKIEHNYFELERLSPMARFPTKYGLDPLLLQTWPWASVIEMMQNEGAEEEQRRQR